MVGAAGRGARGPPRLRVLRTPEPRQRSGPVRGWGCPAPPGRPPQGPDWCAAGPRSPCPRRSTRALSRRTHRAARASIRNAVTTVSGLSASGGIAVFAEPADRAVQGAADRAWLEAELARRLVGAHEHELA